MMYKKKFEAMIYLAIAQSLIAMNIVSAKYALTYIPGQLYVTLRYSFAFLFSMLLFLGQSNKVIPSKQTIKLSFPILFIQAISGGILFNIPMTSGLKYTDASVAGIITSLLPIITILISWLFFKSKLSKNSVLAITVSFIGLLCVSGQGMLQQNVKHNIYGDFLVFLAIIPEAFYCIFSHRFKPNVSLQFNACITFGINTFLFLIYLYFQLDTIPAIPTPILLLLVFQGFSLSMYYLIWLKGCHKANETLISISAAFMPITTLGLGVLFLHEHLTMLQLAGITLILGTILFHQEIKTE